MKNKVYSQLEQLWRKHGAQEFGKICQILLGICLNQLQFRVQIFQLSGRPDIVALRNNENFAFEVKTQSSSEATLKPEDLEGVKEYSEHAIIAVLSYPDLDCNWVLANANRIKSGKWPISFLKQYSISRLENEVDEIFPTILDNNFIFAEKGTTVLYERFNDLMNLERKRK
jgi:hypothetical protein